MTRPNHKEWTINHEGIEIRVTSWFMWAGQFSAKLFIGGRLLDTLAIDQSASNDIKNILDLVDPDTPILRARTSQNEYPTWRSIRVAPLNARSQSW